MTAVLAPLPAVEDKGRDAPRLPAPHRPPRARTRLVQVLAIYAASRVVSTVWYLVAAAIAVPGAVHGSRPALMALLLEWDAGWYRTVALQGYPSVLPQDAAGDVMPNQWAFMPLQPMLVRLLSAGQTAAMPGVAVALATLAGAGAALALFGLVRRHGGDRAALVAVALFALGPASAVLEAGYAESLALLLLFLLLDLVDRHRYWAALAAAVPAALTRPGLQAVALVVLLHLLSRAWTVERHGLHVRLRRAAGPFPYRERVAGAALFVGSGLLGFLWPAIAFLATGRSDAYLATEVSWRRSLVGIADLRVFHSWPSSAERLLGAWPGRFVVAGLVAAVVVLTLSPAARRLGALVRLWFVAWWVYLFAVFYPQSSVLRLLLPLAPMGGVLGRLRPVPLALVLAACVAAQGALVVYQYSLPIAAGWSAP